VYIIIVGAGRVGYSLATRLIADKHAVVLIDSDKEVCEELAKILNALVICGDGCDPHVLEDARIDRCDVVAVVTGSDEDNLVICQLAKEKFHVARTVSRVNDPANEKIFSQLGVDVPIDATEIIAKIVEEEVSFADFVNLLSFKRGKLAIVRVDLPADSPVIKKDVQSIKLPADSVFVSIIRGDEVIVPKGDTVLEAGDDIIALTLIENEQQLLNALIGKI